MTPAEARRQLLAMTATLRAQGHDAAADHLQRALRRHRQARIEARYRQNLKPPLRAPELPSLRHALENPRA